MSLTADKIITLKNKERLSYNSVFNQLYPGLCVFAKGFLLVPNDAEDLVQEVFLSLWNKYQKFDSMLGIKAFLYQSTRNKCLNQLRHEKIKQRFEKEHVAKVETETYFLQQVLQDETNRIIRQAIDELPLKYKSVMQLSLRGLMNKEIAEQLDLSVNTIKSQKAQAHNILREKLQNVLELLFHLLMV